MPDIPKKLGTGISENKGAMGDVDPRSILEPGDDACTSTPPAAKPKPED
jgi:hypothetical protein